MKSLTKASTALKEKFHIDINELSARAQKGLNDVEENHNTCWVRDLYNKNKNNFDETAIFYRGTKITYRTLFENAIRYAKVFEQKGIKKGSEVPMCMSNCPEFLYSIMGLNLLGAKMNCFGTFDNDYLKDIISDTDSSLLICTDDKYLAIKDALDASDKKEIIMFSLADSLKNGVDPYIELDKEFYDFKNKVALYSEFDKRIVSKENFLKNAGEITLSDIENYNYGNINTEFLITYSSGSTNSKRPKAIVHSNRSLITIGRFQDSDMSDLPTMKGLIGEAMIPTHSNTGIICSMSDVLYKGCTVAMEPIYHKDFLLPSFAINKPNYITVPTNMIVDAAKKIYSDQRYTDFKMPYMMMLTAVGEPTSPGEEKFINKMLRKSNAGSEKLPRPISPVPLSIGGGDCERGGMFFTPYRKFQDLLPQYLVSKDKCQLKKYDMVQLAILDEDDVPLPYGQVGRLVAKTPTQMIRYKNNDEATKDFYIQDHFGNWWTDCKVYARMERNGTVDILERIGNEFELEDGIKVPLYKVGDTVAKDTKNVLSYYVVNNGDNVIVHVEKQPESKKSMDKILYSIDKRIQKNIGKEISDKVVYRVRSFDEGFPRTACEKRNGNVLKTEGLSDKCVKPVLGEDGNIELVPATEYLRNITSKKKIYKKNSCLNV